MTVDTKQYIYTVFNSVSPSPRKARVCLSKNMTLHRLLQVYYDIITQNKWDEYSCIICSSTDPALPKYIFNNYKVFITHHDGQVEVFDLL
jgi:hypothetical protein